MVALSFGAMEDIIQTSGGTEFHQTTVETTSSLEDLQSNEQRRVLDTVSSIRKCSLDTILSLPQLVVCGDQSSGKSSVLEALTEIPFPRSENLCTRFATEIVLRRANIEKMSIKIIPDSKRHLDKQASINSFSETIQDFAQLPKVIRKAANVMGLFNNASKFKTRAFAREVLSIEIEGPSRPQLTLVDIPGLIQTETKGITDRDISVVAEITERYISQHRTICLAVVSATNDYANQGILTKVRKVDPEGERTLGIITKPDRLPKGSNSEAAFIELARNHDVFFKLGWHVVKNREFEQANFSFEERNDSEAQYFESSNFKALPSECLGIDNLRVRFSNLLFEHVKQELPNLRNDLESALKDARGQMVTLGQSRSSVIEGRNYLTNMSLDIQEIIKAAAGGHYEGHFFSTNVEHAVLPSTKIPLSRFRAARHLMNNRFHDKMLKHGHKFHILDQVEPNQTRSDTNSHKS